jgi:hypothetical protein
VEEQQEYSSFSPSSDGLTDSVPYEKTAQVLQLRIQEEADHSREL